MVPCWGPPSGDAASLPLRSRSRKAQASCSVGTRTFADNVALHPLVTPGRGARQWRPRTGHCGGRIVASVHDSPAGVAHSGSAHCHQAYRRPRPQGDRGRWTDDRFAYQGIQYEIDLSEKNAKKLGKALAPFLAAARRVSTRAPQPKVIAADVDTKAVRKWAESTAYRCQPGGRIPAHIVEQYRAAGNQAKRRPAAELR